MTDPSPPPPSKLRRVLASPPVCLLASLLIVAGAGALVMFTHLKPGPHDLSERKALVAEVVMALGALLAQLGVGLGLERARLDALGWGAPRASRLAAGFGLGVAIQTVVVGLMVLAGWYALVPGSHHTGALGSIATSLVLFAAVAVFEEVVFRGLFFRQLERLLGSWVALVLNAGLFGLVHRGNPGATALSSVAIALEAGVLLTAAYAATGSLWLPLGIHWAWNFFEGPVYGEAVSGTSGYHLLSAHITGPVTWTGGSFGPEAGLVTVIPCTALGLALLAVAVRRGGMWTPPWMQRLLRRT